MKINFSEIVSAALALENPKLCLALNLVQEIGSTR